MTIHLACYKYFNVPIYYIEYDNKQNNLSLVRLMKNKNDFIVPAAGDLINAISLWTSRMSLCCSTSRPLRNLCIT